MPLLLQAPNAPLLIGAAAQLYFRDTLLGSLVEEEVSSQSGILFIRDLQTWFSISFFYLQRNELSKAMKNENHTECDLHFDSGLYLILQQRISQCTMKIEHFAGNMG